MAGDETMEVPDAAWGGPETAGDVETLGDVDFARDDVQSTGGDEQTAKGGDDIKWEGAVIASRAEGATSWRWVTGWQ